MATNSVRQSYTETTGDDKWRHMRLTVDETVEQNTSKNEQDKRTDFIGDPRTEESEQEVYRYEFRLATRQSRLRSYDSLTYSTASW